MIEKIFLFFIINFVFCKPQNTPFMIEPQTGYRNLSQINKILFETEQQYPSISKVINIIKEYGPGSTYEKRPIYAVKFSQNATIEEDKPNILIIAGVHPNEIVNHEVMLRIIEDFPKKYGRDPLITKLFQKYQIFIVPVLNVGKF